MMDELSSWLAELGLDRYAQVFSENGVDLATLPLLSESELEKLGVLLGHRKKLLNALAGSRPVVGRQSAQPAVALQRAPDHARNGEAGERRQLTVLFCDMVGFTELANRVDPEVLQRIIRSYEDACAVCITRYEGYVFQRLGDGIVAFFGYPLAHEGEAERAIHAGLAIIASLSRLDVPEVGRLQVRIGIATGLVVVSSAEKGAVGETMNLASRLQGIASLNTIVVSERVQRLAGGSFAYQDLGEQILKGIARPTRAYRILGVSEAISRFEAAHDQSGLTPLVGRDQELALLLERWALAQDGEGQVVLLSGEPGIGKSRILSALRERLEAQGAQALRFQCSPYYVNSALWPSIDNFERTLKFGRDESPQSKLDKLEDLIVKHYGRPSTDARFIASMLSIPVDERYGPLTITPQKFKDETLRTLVDVSEAAARKQPSVMLYEDVHWADPTSLEELDLLIDRVRSFPLLILLTHRPEFQSRWGAHGHVSALNLSKLTRAQSSAMVAQLAGKPLPAELSEQILSKTDGVPLFVEELTKSILESGELKDAGNRYEYVGAGHGMTIPATLRDSLMARLDRYMPVKEVAQIGAAIGREFSYELISAVAPIDQEQLDDALARLTESGLAFRRGTPPDALYTFKHALVQDAAYDSLLKSRRQDLHAKIARVIEERFPNIASAEPEVLAHHYTQAGQPLRAIPLWQKAGEAALAHLALAESISHLNQGLKLIAALPKSLERDASELGLRIPLGTAWSALKGWPAPEVWSSWHPALPLARSLGRNDALLPILWGLQENVMTQGRVAESLAWVNEARDAAKATGDADLLLTGHLLAFICYFWMGNLIESQEHGDKVLGLYDAEKHRHLAHLTNHDFKTSVGVFGSSCAWMLGYPDRAVRLNEEMEAHTRQRAHPFDYGFALAIGAAVFDFRCEPEKMRMRAEECERIGRDNSMPVLWAMMAPVTYGMALIREGNAAEGVARLKAGLTVWDASGGKLLTPYIKAVLAQGMAMLGEIDGALRLIDEQIAQVERPGWEERVHYAEILRLKGWMLSLSDDMQGAEKNYRASLNWARGQQAKSWELRTATSLARLWQVQGKRKEALDLLKPMYDWFTEGFDTKDLKEAKALLGELAA
jgi:class 3 adenylate cyclase/tetratricopeptide (TPR) repeat protein